jgi:DNA-binding LytR/AlgR family response regulator
MYQIALCEDEKVFSEAGEKMTREIMEKMNVEYRITVFESSEDFLEAFSEEKKRYDLILLDIIGMGKTSGMELARTIRKSDSEAVIIFITSSREHVYEGYDVNALHYLLKPVDAAVLERLIRGAYEDKFQENFFVFKSGAQNQRIPVKDIIALETVDRKVEITLPDRTLHYSGKLAELLDELPKDCFVRCHQAFAVNLGNIREITRFDAVAVNGKRIPISRPYLKDVQTAFLTNMRDCSR